MWMSRSQSVLGCGSLSRVACNVRLPPIALLERLSLLLCMLRLMRRRYAPIATSSVLILLNASPVLQRALRARLRHDRRGELLTC
jgi:hypothetical protein